ncbi:MAG: bifunctional alpha,alpha-trehalose-phosphate synthase (UDP-forming)/trehalose-phosphatase [Armatimonadetes bacterium]|nr:bifunctional alpha,alpha-trehalose-phosphate synthase (UDP-forming)/trehalose-phosphatase [Armatimonadota bacterium]
MDQTLVDRTRQRPQASQIAVRVREALRGLPLVVVSNREPYAHQRSPHGLEVERPAGGLVAALDPVLRELGGLWVAWGSGDADFETTDARDCVGVPPEAPRYTLRRVRLSEDEVERFYHGYANQALWPLFHLAVDKARFVRRYWTAYQAVNRRFAEATLETVEGDAVVWLHDYHLALAPRYLRERRPGLFLMQFWHIPWPAWDVFRICPQRADLLEGLLANDLLGFHVQRHVENFLDCAERELGAVVDRQQGLVAYRGHRTTVQAFPISIDVAAWETVATSRACERWMARLRHRFRLEGRHIGVGVDRLDYTKGLLERLHAIDLLFRRAPALRGRFVFIQKAAPSRTRIKAYRDLQKRVEAEIARINAAYGTPDWQPVIYLPRPLPSAGMAALYRMADVGLVTSLQDGMNLVAKEFVASQVDERGVLVLSELAGASEEVPWSIPVNPYDPEGLADALVQALTMPAPERQRRMAQMRAHLARHDIFHWMEQHLDAAARLLDSRAKARWLFADIDAIRETVLSRDRIAVLLDFDGTLVPIADRPQDVVLTPAMRGRLARLSASPRCVAGVISGRALEDLRARVGLPDLLYAGNHGLELAGPGRTMVHRDAAVAQDLIARVCARLRERLRDIEGVMIEDKGITATVHYRLVQRGEIERVQREVMEELAGTLPGRLITRQGKMALEIRPDLDWHKGKAARWLLAGVLGEEWEDRAAVIYAGDDSTDEDAFATLAPIGITIRVGPGSPVTAARYVVRDTDEMGRLLDALADWVQGTGPAEHELEPQGPVVLTPR